MAGGWETHGQSQQQHFFFLESILECVLLPQHTEALLYGFQSIAETLDVNYSDVIPGLIGLITRISVNNVHLADTVMFTIGAVKTCECSVSDWMRRVLTHHFFGPILTRCFGRMVSRPPRDARQRPTPGASRSGEPRSVNFLCLHTQENLQGVQVRPATLCKQYSSCLSGNVHAFRLVLVRFQWLLHT